MRSIFSDAVSAALATTLWAIPRKAPARAHLLGQIIFHKTPQPFLLHADQARQTLAVLHFFHRLAIALQPAIGEAQAFVADETGHLLEQQPLAFSGPCEAIAQLGEGGADIGIVRHGTSYCAAYGKDCGFRRVSPQ